MARTAPHDLPADAVAPERDVDRLAEGERLASLGALVAGVAHEINNPLTYVLGSLDELERVADALRDVLAGYREIVRREVGPRADALIHEAEEKLHASGGPALEEVIGDALEGTLRVRELVRDLVSLGRPEARTSQPVDPHAVLDLTLRLTRHRARRCAQVTRCYAATRSVLGDPGRLGQVFLNLMQNAIQACEVRCDEDAALHRIVVRTRDTERGVAVDIEDSGVGIPPEIASCIFRAFFTTRPPDEGTGLGLFMAHRLVEELGGRLDFHPARCQGTVFTVELPEAGSEAHTTGDL